MADYTKLRSVIRELIDAELEETTTTGDVAPFMTKFAFRGNEKGGKDKSKEISTQSGFSIVDGEEKSQDPGHQYVESIPFGDKGTPPKELKKPKKQATLKPDKKKVDEATLVKWKTRLAELSTKISNMGG